MLIFAVSGWKGSGKDMVATHLVERYGFKRVSFADPLKDRVAKQFGVDRSAFDDPARKEKPILSMPVTPKDGYSRMIAEFMPREFRSAAGHPPLGFVYKGEEYYGRFHVLMRNGEIWDRNNIEHQGADVREEHYRVYWTPRALAILEGSTKRAADPDHWVKQAVAEMDPNGLYVVPDLRYVNEVNSLCTAAPNSVVPIRIERFESSPSEDPSERELDSFPFPFVINNKNVGKAIVYSQVEEILRQKGVLGERIEISCETTETTDSDSSSQASA